MRSHFFSLACLTEGHCRGASLPLVGVNWERFVLNVVVEGARYVRPRQCHLLMTFQIGTSDNEEMYFLFR